MNQEMDQLDFSVISANFSSDDKGKTIVSSRVVIKLNGVKIGTVHAIQMEGDINEPEVKATIKVVRTKENAIILDRIKEKFSSTVKIIEV
jgi:hypothetical protein